MDDTANLTSWRVASSYVDFFFFPGPVLRVFTLLSVEAVVVEGDVRGVAVRHVLLHRPDDFAETPVAT